ncbi:thiamine pyrophosphate-dependent acetolactate synthase large subunit-like protein [Streptomyces olivoverticillatus]|uniref:Thiamine pyrophosphate-dependent acetolactate synthase large subunit-like protein n=1 Tax=Streptomyces olivoverticillatus TaxID=66427 RepID=A0A7W7LSN9_9ACTN|nr:hypothetical protein [Streptomyces olivoverticillatus]MBB4895514.1 thiamine pyrophosphate-dependent acetolactate synthase large subunit-like protein [Streptomyces olivoverticillatus]
MPTSSSPELGHRFLILSVGKHPAFHAVVAGALGELTTGSRRRLGPGDGGNTILKSSSHSAEPPAAHAETLARALRYLDRALPEAELRHVTADTLPAAARALRELPPPPAGGESLPLLLVDADGAGLGTEPFDRALPDALAALADDLPAHLRSTLTAHGTLVYDAAAPAGTARVHVARPYVLRALPAHDWVLSADVVCAFTDHVQVRHTGSALRTATRTGTSALATALHSFLGRQPGGPWGLHYYTGSVVSGTIADLDRLAATTGNPVLRGPSEHALACGALARWQLDGAPFLIVVTSGMVDEFRGTLANMRDARARGFVVCAETTPGAWYPFQGTVHAAEDSRAVLAAKGLPHVYLDDPDRLEDGLAEACAAYHAGRGPVFLLATPAVLDAAGSPDRLEALARSHARPPAATLDVTESALEPVRRLVESGPARLLWQCGPLDAEESGLVHDIAARAGIALADSLTHPGSVAKYRDGKAVEEYLGTLGMYAFSARVHDYLHEDGRLRPRSEQALLFLKSRIAEAATPFSPAALARRLRIVQVTHERAHLAPFADHPVHAAALPFLTALRAGLDISPELLAARRDAIARTRESTSDVVHRLPVLPMSANYFFRRLHDVLDDLIRTTGYTYTGVFDVGRGGLSAIRNLPRTGPGFSGWYGRALMGDALQAVPAVALTRDDNVLAFIGDGATALVPDILPTLIQQAALYERGLRRNLTVFRLIDGGHSVIRTYREGRAGAEASRQTQVLHLLEPEWTRTYGELTVRHRHVHDAADADLHTWLRQEATVTICSVLLSHNNEGDGLSLLSSLGWQRDDLPELAFALAQTPRGTH